MSKLNIGAGVLAITGAIAFFFGLLTSGGVIGDDLDELTSFQVNMGLCFTGLYLMTVGLLVFKPTFGIIAVLLTTSILLSILAAKADQQTSDNKYFVNHDHLTGLIVAAGLSSIATIGVTGVLLYLGA